MLNKAIKTNLFIGDIFWCVFIHFKQLVKSTNFLGKLVGFLAYEMMQSNVMLLIFVNQFVSPTSLTAANLQRVSRNWKHLILKHLTVHSNDSRTFTA